MQHSIEKKQLLNNAFKDLFGGTLVISLFFTILSIAVQGVLLFLGLHLFLPQ